MFLLHFKYAVLGVQMFHGVALNPDGLLTDDANFRSLPEALLTLFRASTGESWNGVMHDLQCQPHGMDWSAQLLGSPPRLPRCMADGSDCGSFVAVPYFVTFTLLSFFLLLNAVIGVLLEHFSENPEDNPLPPGNFESFAVEWSKLDLMRSLRTRDVASVPLCVCRRWTRRRVLGADRCSSCCSRCTPGRAASRCTRMGYTSMKF